MSEAALIWQESLGPAEVRRERGLDALDLAILAKLASVANDDDLAWMRVEDLADKVGTSERNVQYRLRKLQGQAWVKGKAKVPAVIKDTGKKYRRGTRELPWYELLVDHAVVGAELARRKARRDRQAMVRLPMGATVCTHGRSGKVDPCTPMGATVCAPKEPIRDLSEANASSASACDDVVGQEEAASPSETFRTAFGVWPASGAAATKWAPAWAAWPAAVVDAGGEARLLACVQAFAADPMLKRRNYGAGAMQRWLSDGGWRSYFGVIERAVAGQAAVPGGRFPGPPEIRALVVEALGENSAHMIIDPAGWDPERAVVRARTGYAFNQLTKLWPADAPWSLASPLRTPQ